MNLGKHDVIHIKYLLVYLDSLYGHTVCFMIWYILGKQPLNCPHFSNLRFFLINEISSLKHFLKKIMKFLEI